MDDPYRRHVAPPIPIRAAHRPAATGAPGQPAPPLSGRERELAAAVARLRRPGVRLLTLLGPAGIGKTRLALAIADALSADFPDGIHVVDLAPLHDPDLVLPAILRAIAPAEGSPAPGQTPLDLLTGELGARRHLLVLDGLERVVAAAPEIVTLLSACPALTVLATSRVALAVRGEQRFPLTPLAADAALPDPTSLTWSDDLLTPEQGALLRRLAVFAGGFTAEAVESVIGHAATSPPSSLLQGLAVLHERGLLRRLGGTDERPRFALPAAVREQAVAHLAASPEEAALRDAHAAYVLALAEDVAASGPEPAGAASRQDALLVDLADLRAADDWLRRRGGDAAALRLGAALSRVWLIPAHRHEGLAWLERLLALPTCDAHPALAARLASAAGAVAAALADRPRAETHHDRALAFARTDGDPHALALALRERGRFLLAGGEAEAAAQALRAAATEAEMGGDLRLVGQSEVLLGDALLSLGDAEAALECYERARDRLHGAGDVAGAACATAGAALTRLALGQMAEARRILLHLLDAPPPERPAEVGRRCLAGLAALAAAGGAAPLAARLYGAVATDQAEEGTGIASVLAASHEGWRARVAAALGPAAWEAELAGGRNLSLAEAEAAARRWAQGGAETGEEPEAPKRGPVEPLSPREREVLRLVVAGQSDREIADTLSISRRTASNHVAAILAKLGVSSRTAAATRAVRDGLISPEPQ